MIDHHVQKHVISILVESETARYADLKPENMDGNVFTHHLKVLMKQGLITKNQDGKYELTSAGKLYGINSSLQKDDVLRQAHSIILLSIREGGNRWLLRKRLVQPMYGKIGFIHGEPTAGENIDTAAARILQRRTELSGKFAVKGFGYVQLNHDEDLIAYSHFTLVEVSDLTGNLKETDSHGENLWLTKPDFSNADMIPSMQALADQITKPGLFFLDLSYAV